MFINALCKDTSAAETLFLEKQIEEWKRKIDEKMRQKEAEENVRKLRQDLDTLKQEYHSL